MQLPGHLLLLSSALCAQVLAEVLFRCPPCSQERLAACPAAAPSPRPPCLEQVREPGCGCCPVCARLEGESCGVYTARCATGLRCYPHPGSELPLQALVQGQGTCCKKRDAEYGSSQERGAEIAEDRSDTMIAENTVIVTGNQEVRRNHVKSAMKEIAVNRERTNEQQRSKINKHPHSPEDKKMRQPSVRSLCQQQLDLVLERISAMHLPDERGPLEHLYSLHIPNCDKNGYFNLKQCKMSVNGQRGECWCVNPSTGKILPGAPTIRGDPECHLYYTNPEEERGTHALRAQ
ncbi:insulin-like growth factor-binding protein 2 [Bombina bombina]|uniref:insulin-like growth factor-binding protein 2 n=1 Tax=Bombina bombina TaxID=8345 RepID=UPI00235AEE17|nr:insulin-like growth factor-binding protein 2 [Bombina bombina]